MSYCAGCGQSGTSPCVNCGSWEFVDQGGLELLRSVGKIDPNLKGINDNREQQANDIFGSPSVYSTEQIRIILRQQGYNV